MTDQRRSEFPHIRLLNLEVNWPTVETVNLESDDDLVNWQIRTLFRHRYQPDTNNMVGFWSARGPEARRWES